MKVRSWARGRVRKSAVGVVALVALAAVPLVATSSAATKKPTGTPWKLGALNIMTGAGVSSAGSYTPTLHAWEKWTNANGGINGRPVKVIAINAPDPATANAGVRKLIDQEKVQAIVDGNTILAAWGPYALQKNVPVMGEWGDPGTATFNNAYNPGASDAGAGRAAVANNIKRLQKHRVAVAYCAEYPQCAGIATAFKQLGDKYKFDMVSGTSVAATAPNYTATCLAAKSAKADAFYPGAAMEVQIKIIDDCAQQNFKPRFFSGQMNLTNGWLKSKNTDGVVGSTGLAPWFLKTTPGLKAMHAGLAKYSKVLQADYFGVSTTAAWAQAELFKRAAELGKTQSTAGIFAGLKKMKNETLGGLAPAFTYPKSGNPNANFKCYYQVTIRKGKWTAPSGLKPICQ